MRGSALDADSSSNAVKAPNCHSEEPLHRAGKCLGTTTFDATTAQISKHHRPRASRGPTQATRTGKHAGTTSLRAARGVPDAAREKTKENRAEQEAKDPSARVGCRAGHSEAASSRCGRYDTRAGIGRSCSSGRRVWFPSDGVFPLPVRALRGALRAVVGGWHMHGVTGMLEKRCVESVRRSEILGRIRAAYHTTGAFGIVAQVSSAAVRVQTLRRNGCMDG
jgi:hypothetical protein